MAETTVEKITRNKAGSIILIIFGALLVMIIGFDFYKLFHMDSSRSFWIKMLDTVQLVAAAIGLLWLALLLIVSSLTMSEPSFKKTCPYTVTFLFAMGAEIIRRACESKGHPFWFWIVVGVAVAVLTVVLLQMLAFSLDPHSNSMFTVFRPFRIEVLTVIRLSSQSPSIKRVERSSIV